MFAFFSKGGLMANVNAHTPAQRAAATIAELQQTHDGKSPVRDPLILIRALTRACHRHGGKELELLPVTIPGTTFSIFGAHFKATRTDPEAFAVVVCDTSTNEYEFASSGTPQWNESKWLTEVIDHVMKETRDLELHRIPKEISHGRH
jgi:hypothetical protein